jgi:hypothetical protein
MQGCAAWQCASNSACCATVQNIKNIALLLSRNGPETASFILQSLLSTLHCTTPAVSSTRRVYDRQTLKANPKNKPHQKIMAFVNSLTFHPEAWSPLLEFTEVSSGLFVGQTQVIKVRDTR